MSSIIRVSERSRLHAAQIDKMDRICFPDDPPIEVKPCDGAGGKFSAWWIVQDKFGLPIAYAGLWRMEDWHDYYLCRAGVIPEARGKGLQRRLIRVRVAEARRQMDARNVVTDTVYWNPASMNSLIGEGFRVYEPTIRWKPQGYGVVYWRKQL